MFHSSQITCTLLVLVFSLQLSLCDCNVCVHYIVMFYVSTHNIAGMPGHVFLYTEVRCEKYIYCWLLVLINDNDNDNDNENIFIKHKDSL